MKKAATLIQLSTAMLLGGLPVYGVSESWTVASQQDWESNQSAQTNLEIKDGMATPTGRTATFQSRLKSFPERRSAASITIGQSPVWENWNPVENIGPANLGDAPVFLRMSEGDYWMFGRYDTVEHSKQFTAKSAQLEGFDIPLKTTVFPNVFDALGAEEAPLGGYHAWQTKDMVNWVHHGPVSDLEAKWMTTAEVVDGKVYLYYDFPNDQDPHLIIDEDLTDGKIGTKMGMAFKDPSHGSDCAIIRDLDGKFHLILENWDPIKASAHAWDSPLASHAVSDNGINEFQLLDTPAVDYRTEPTGKMDTFRHPHWTKEDPTNYPKNVARYEVHKPAQDAYGDWASISIGGQYYLFGDNDPAKAHGKNSMSVAWFTASSIYEPFTYCGKIGRGHPDPDVMFANGQFYLATQMKTDFVSPGPWVEGVEVRVGVDTDKDGSVDQWTDWQEVKETYAGISGFAKQVAKTPAQLDLSGLPAGYGFQFELRLTDTTDNRSKPILDQIELSFE